ncbi:MAG TPA: PepSY-associated TM helix domain-containing protein [Candidatus Competibacteraceae bacterium]|nr:PepSY-associated TM helix domain-containing protein [Candidatus Competibacteraceae bacterium]
MRKRRWRSLLTALHKYLGLCLGVLFVLSGLTGSVLVFRHELDAWLNPHILRSQPHGRASRPLADIVVAARSALPEGTPIRLVAPRNESGVYQVFFRVPDPAVVRVEVAVDPYDGKVRAVREWGGYAISWLYRLHESLLLGRIGHAALGWCGLAILVLLLSGLWLWWPRRGAWPQALVFRSGAGTARRLFDVHRLGGVYGLVVVLVIVSCGVAMVFEETLETWVARISPLSDPLAGYEAAAASAAPAIDVDQVLAIADRTLPQGRWRRIFLPSRPGEPYRVEKAAPDDAFQTGGLRRVWVEPADGRVIAVSTPDRFTAGETLLAWIFPLHNGEAFGWAGRLLVCLAGLLPALLYGSGLWLWWRKCRKRQSVTVAQPPCAAPRHCRD